jgi:hypothetical protein
MITKADIENPTTTLKTLVKYAREYKIKNYSRKDKQTLQSELLEAIKQPVPETKTTEKETPKAFFDRVSALLDVDEVRKECEQLIKDLGIEKLTTKSKFNKLQPYTRNFKKLTPKPETIHLFFDYCSTPNQDDIPRHLFFKFTGLADADWEKANTEAKKRKVSKKSKDEVADALNEEYKIFSLEKYVSTIKQLLNSNVVWELGVGLIAASARRPSEVTILGNFESVENIPEYIVNKEYAIQLDGLAKKRDKNPTTIVPLLIPTSEFIQALETFRNKPEIKKYKETFDNLLSLGYEKSDAWKTLENTLGGELRKVTECYFNFLPKINDENQNRKNILLRACTTKCITLRDKPDATRKAQLTYAGIIDGHIIPQFKEDGSVDFDGKINASTLHYDDYEPDNKNIPLLNNIVKLELQESKEDMVKITELNAKIENLEKQLAAKDEEISALKSKLEYRKVDLPDVDSMDNKMLFHTRKSGSSDEKLTRAWNALISYNSNTPEYKIAPTNQVLRSLTGVNGGAIGKWMKVHEDEVKTYCRNFKAYYNNKYRNKTDISTESIIEKIRQEYLEIQ